MSCNSSTRPLKDILPYILPNCTALPEEMAMDYGRRAYVEFARRSGGLVQYFVTDLQEGVADYPIKTNDNEKVNRVNTVRIEGSTFVLPTYDYDSVNLTGRSSYDPSGYASGSMRGSYGYGPNYWYSCGAYRFHMNGYECLILHEAPIRDCTNGLEVGLSVFPTQETCTFDSDFFDRWVEGVTYGALAKAMMLTNTEWFNPQLAAVYERKFNIEVQRARHKFDLNYSRGPMRMQARRFV